MAVCNWCDQEMMDPAVTSCSGNLTVDFPDGESLAPSTWHHDEPNGRCHDCGIKHGGFHHPGCDAERCPRCEGQLISCGCLDQVMLSETILAAAAVGIDGVMKSPDNGKICLEGVPDDFHVFVNGEPTFDGDEVCESDLIELRKQNPRRIPGPFVRPTRWQVLWGRIRGWLARWAINFSHKGRL